MINKNIFFIDTFENFEEIMTFIFWKWVTKVYNFKVVSSIRKIKIISLHFKKKKKNINYDSMSKIYWWKIFY